MVIRSSPYQLHGIICIIAWINRERNPRKQLETSNLNRILFKSLQNHYDSMEFLIICNNPYQLHGVILTIAWIDHERNPRMLLDALNLNKVILQSW